MPHDFSSIQAAIDNASPGDIILVPPGIYYEQLVINKSITIKGENETTTIINGNASGICIQITADNVVVTGFTIQNALIGIIIQSSNYTQTLENIITATSWESIILSQSSSNLITNNTISNNSKGIHLVLSSNNTISHNKIDSNYECGVLLNNSTNNLIESNGIHANHSKGIYLADSSGNLIAKNTITLSSDDGVILQRSQNNSLRENTVLNNFHCGFYLVDSENNTLGQNVLSTNGWSGVQLYHSNNNRALNNVESNNENAGLYLFCSANNLLQNNTMVDNAYNFRIYGECLNDFLNDIDVSNKVDGKMLYYWINRHGSQVPSDAGYVAVINSTDIRISGLVFTHNGQGVLVAYTNNSFITGVEITSNLYGIHFFHANGNQIALNKLTNNVFGMFIQNSEDNTFYFNTVSDSTKGVVESYAIENRFFRNNLVNQSMQTDLYQSFDNLWDADFEGNHWDSYVGVDENGDGIGDVPFALDSNNRDNYPLMRFYFPGDVNHNGMVDTADMGVVAQTWQSRIGDLDFSSFADLNLDVITDTKDAVFLGLFWERGA